MAYPKDNESHAQMDGYMLFVVQVFFDINIGGTSAGRVVMELRADVVPKTAGEAPLARHSGFLPTI